MADGGPEAGLTLYHFFLSGEALAGERVRFPAEQAHQITRVLRLRPGDEVVVLDGRGGEATVSLDQIGREVRGHIVTRRKSETEPATRLTLSQGLLKGPKIEWVWQKCTELGVSAFVPVTTQRPIPTEPNTARQRRFAAIVREAAEQSRRGIIPLVSSPATFSAAISGAVASGPTALLGEDEERVHLSTVALPTEISAVSLFVGPEEGFDPEEVGLARDAGARIVTLGRRILRAETAAVVGAALLLARLATSGELTPFPSAPYNRAHNNAVGGPFDLPQHEPRLVVLRVFHEWGPISGEQRKGVMGTLS